MKINRLKIQSYFIALLVLVTSLSGLISANFIKGCCKSVEIYGNQFELYGSGIYRDNTKLMAAGFLGTDFALLLILPILLIAIGRFKKESLPGQLAVVGLLSVVLYYSYSLSLGASYNELHLVYIALFGLTLFTLAEVIMAIDLDRLQRASSFKMTKGLILLLVLLVFAVSVAWIPDIISSIINNTRLATIEIYTTSVVNVIDIAVLAPLMILAIVWCKRNNPIGLIALSGILFLAASLGLILPLQVMFQNGVGIDIPVSEMVSKVLIFILLSAGSAYFAIRLLKSVKTAN